LRSHNSRKQAPRQHGAAAAPAPVSPPLHAKSCLSSIVDGDGCGRRGSAAAAAAEAERGQEALRLATSFGKSALLTHLAHQHDDLSVPRPYTYSAVDWARIMGEPSEEAAASAVGSPTTTPAGFRSHANTLQPGSAEAGVAALTAEVEHTWARLDADAKVRWITSTPQGRRALRQATATVTATGIRSDPCHAATAVRVPSMEQMLSKYADALVRPRLPRTAALSPAPKPHLLRKLFAEGEQEQEAQGSPEDQGQPSSVWREDLRMHSSDRQDSSNRANLRLKADVAYAMEREKVWFQSLASCLGGDNAVKFVNDVKSLQRPREENAEYGVRGPAANTSSGLGGGATPPEHSTEAFNTTLNHREMREPIYSAGLLELCEELGIRSPRRAYVRVRVLQAVDEAAATAQPLTLDQVRDLTTRYGAQYDQEVQAIAKDAQSAESNVTPAQAVRDFEKFQLELAVDQVRVKLSKFQDDVPLLRSCTSAFNK
jgi:hypothetical protein